MSDPESCPTCAVDSEAPNPASAAERGVKTQACCALEAVVSVDERGQLVLPKDLRVRAGIGPGDRLAVVSNLGEDGAICCITLVKAGAVAGAVRSVIGPALGVE